MAQGKLYYRCVLMFILQNQNRFGYMPHTLWKSSIKPHFNRLAACCIPVLEAKCGAERFLVVLKPAEKFGVWQLHTSFGSFMERMYSLSYLIMGRQRRRRR